MNKHEALLALEKAHKLRKHADKLEKQAYEILDEKKEHEATASASPAFEKARQHVVLHALHTMNKDCYKAQHDVAKYIADNTNDKMTPHHQRQAEWRKGKSEEHAAHAENHRKAALAGFKVAGYPDHKVAGVFAKAKKHFEKKHGDPGGDAYDHDWFEINKSIKKAKNALGH